MEVNDVIKSYELRAVLGEGGFGKVFSAWHKTINREVAMKVILPLYANQPEFIERFELEAQLVAKLEHPNIVPLYDFWRDPDGAYLVMRLIRGGSLGDVILQNNLDNKLWDIEHAAKLLEQIASALHIAHRNKIIHQDIKPANILLDEDGNGYLTDFGIARDLESDINLAQDENNVLHGSPKYISPEHLKRSEITHKSDIYSLGLLMYEVLTGDPAYDSTKLLELLQMHLKRKIPALQEKRPDLPEALNAPLRQATTRNPHDRYDSVLDFAHDFNAIVQQVKYGGSVVNITAPATEMRRGLLVGDDVIDNPYKGLAAFQETDVADFFGRTALTHRLLERVIERDAKYNRLLAVVGASGSGKSSVVRAGVIPKIRAGAIAGMTFYTATMIPGVNPMRSLEGAVLRVASRASDDFLNKLSQPNFDLMEVLELSLPKTGEMLLIIDQFEEIFTLTDDKTRRDHFLQTIHDAITHPKSRVRVIITMRADFTGRALQERVWGEMIQNRTELVPNMSVSELREAIEKPAERVGLVFQEGLVDQIITDVQSEVGSLPLLQYTLNELYERRNGIELTRDSYKELGGISGAMEKRANETYQALSDEEKLLTQQILSRLITLGEGVEDTRRREFLQNLFSMHDDSTMVDEVLIKFQNGHLIARNYDKVTGDIVVEVAHETLIRRWQLLRGWLDDNRNALRLQAALTIEVRQWIDNKRGADFLAYGDRLSNFRQLLDNKLIALSQGEREYLLASNAAQKQRQRRRQQRIAALAIAAIISAIAAVTASFFWQQSVTAEREAVVQRDIAETQRVVADEQSILARSRELAASALLYSETQPDRAVLLSLQAIESSSTFEARNAFLTAMQSQPRLTGYLNGHSDQIRSMILNPDKTMLASGARNGEVIIWDVATRQAIQHLEGFTNAVNAIAFSPDSSQLAATGNDGKLIVWDTSTWDLQYDEVLDENRNNTNGLSLTFSPDGTTIALGDNLGQLYLWDAAGGAALDNFQAHEDAIYAVAFSPDGDRLATGSGDTVLKLWDTASWEMTTEFTDHSNWILDLTFSPDGRFLASASADTTIRLWDMQALEGLGSLTGHKDGVRSILFTSDSRRLISADADGVIIVNDLFDRQNSFMLPSPENSAVRDIEISGTDLLVASESDSIFVVSLTITGTFPFNRTLATLEDRINRVVISPDSTLLAAGGGNATNFDISILNLESGETQIISEHQNIISDMVWNGNRLISGDVDGRVVMWEAGEISTFNNNESVLSVAASGSRVTIGDSQGNITLWDISISPPEVIDQLDAHDDSVLALDFNFDSTRLISGGRDNTLTLWDMETLTQIGESWTGHTNQVITVTFSPDGQFVASGSHDKSIIIWDVASGQAVGTALTGHIGSVTDLAYSPDGTVLVSSSNDSTLLMWDTTVFRQLGLPLRRHSNVVFSVDYSADGKWIVSGGINGDIVL
ncbi:MAG: protein kinase, partial [Anaerolineae bacterium]|nr:protein kinase [Anaerolineae bacterium]